MVRDDIKGQVHPQVKIRSLPTQPDADGKSGEVTWSTKLFRSFTLKWDFSILVIQLGYMGTCFKTSRNNWDRKEQKTNIKYRHTADVRCNSSLQNPRYP